jgi:hypothetical protein
MNLLQPAAVDRLGGLCPIFSPKSRSKSFKTSRSKLANLEIEVKKDLDRMIEESKEKNKKSREQTAREIREQADDMFRSSNKKKKEDSDDDESDDNRRKKSNSSRKRR